MPVDLIVAVVVLGLGVALSPVAVIAAILLLVSPGGRVKGTVFVAGWMVGLAAVGVLVTALESAIGVGAADGSGRVVSFASLAAGVLLLAYAVLRWRKRPGPGDDDPAPGWMAALEAAGTGRALGLGAVLAVAKPKNLVLTLAAATAVAEAAPGATASVVALAVYLVVASASVGVPLVVAVALGERASALLAGWKAWLMRNNAAIMTVVFVAFGILLAWKGVTGLV